MSEPGATSPTERAVRDFQQGCSCAQAVFAAFAAGDIDRGTALRVAAGFGGGIARLGHTCGAVTGGVMALGAKHGAEVAGSEEAKLRFYERVRGFVAGFESRHGASECRTLLGVDIGTPEGMTRAREQNLFATRCPGYVRTAGELLQGMV